jgi:hypothetical protein
VMLMHTNNVVTYLQGLVESGITSHPGADLVLPVRTS